jgi:hypothetical protein
MGMGPEMRLAIVYFVTRDDGFAVWSDTNSVADHVGISESEQLLARVCMPHPHIIVTARSIELR